MTIDRPNQIWAMDITYYPDGPGLRLPRRRGRLVQPSGAVLAVVDHHDDGFLLEAVEEALAKHGKPAIINTDQGSQFTSSDFVGLMLANRIEISMDGKGSWRDNVFVERLWRSVKYEEVCLKAYDSVADARAALEQYFDFYNSKRPHSSHGGRTPDQVYWDNLPQAVAA